MNIAKQLALVSSLLLAAGCAHKEGSSRYSETYSPTYGAGGTTTYGSTTSSVAPTDTSSTTLNQPSQTTSTTTFGTTNASGAATSSSADQQRIYHESKAETSSAETTAPQLSQPAQAGAESTNRFSTTESVTGTSTNQSAVGEPSQALTPTSRPDASSRLYSTNQSATGTSELFSANVQGTTEADRSLGQNIIQELRSDTSLAASLPMVKVSVDNAKVTISGTVKNEDEKSKIETAVQKVTGVSSVQNQLQVSTNPAATDSNK